MQNVIIKKALVLLGSGSGSLEDSGKNSKAENLCEEFVGSSIEETMLAVRWAFALKRVSNIEGENQEFREVPQVNDCLKIAVIAPSNLEWYTKEGKVYFKGNMSTMFYYPKRVLDGLLNNDIGITRQVPESFKLLSALSLAAQVSFALYSDSIFTEGLRKQYLLKLDEVRRVYSVDCNIVNSAML